MKTAFVCPGQGSQSVGMLDAIAPETPTVEKTFKQAADLLGYDAWELVTKGPGAILNQTIQTQPMLLAASVALWRVWLETNGKRPEFLAGHSLGEYSALVIAGVLDFEDALQLVKSRAEYMQAAVPEGMGAMAAILGLEDEQVVQVCIDSADGEVVQAVNFNSPGQVVIAGNKSAVERAMVNAKASGAKRALPLPVSVPSHCELMRPAAELFAVTLNQFKFNLPQIPVIHNVDVAMHEHPDDIRAILAAQLYRPVQWTQTIQWFADHGVTHCYECGPGSVLTGLIKRIHPPMVLANLTRKEVFHGN